MVQVYILLAHAIGIMPLMVRLGGLCSYHTGHQPQAQFFLANATKNDAKENTKGHKTLRE